MQETIIATKFCPHELDLSELILLRFITFVLLFLKRPYSLVFLAQMLINYFGHCSIWNHWIIYQSIYQKLLKSYERKNILKSKLSENRKIVFPWNFRMLWSTAKIYSWTRGLFPLKLLSSGLFGLKYPLRCWWGMGLTTSNILRTLRDILQEDTLLVYFSSQISALFSIF